MIFNSNNTSLGSSIAMAEGYDGSMGCALALIESATNHRAMFMEMLKVEATALSGSLNESQLVSLQEATGAGLLSKIKDLLKKLIAKIKAIFTTFMSKLNSLFMSDKAMVKKYRQVVNKKRALGKMEVKWAKVKELGKTELSGSSKVQQNVEDLKTKVNKSTGADDSESDRVERYYEGILNKKVDAADFEKEYHDECFEEMEKMELDKTDAAGIVGIMNYLETGEKTISIIKSNNASYETALNKLIKFADDEFTKASRESKPGNTEDLSTAKLFYDEACAFQTATLKHINCQLQAYKYKHAMYKAAFMKAIAVNDKKLNENAEYLDALEEAATDEVDGVFDSFLNKETISDLSAASTDLFANGRDDDPESITKGSFDSNSKSVSEGADFFGAALY